MNRKIFFIFLLLIIGCSTSTTTSKSAQVNVYVGSEGLTAEFAKTAPPPRVFEQSSFPILIKIRNKGAYSVGVSRAGILAIGREKDYVPEITLEPNPKMGQRGDILLFGVEGKTKINPKGDELIAAITAKTSKLDPQSENKESTITATLCYPYQTLLSTTVCIDPDIGELRPSKKACNVKEISFNTGQGAPIAVTRIEPQMIPEGDIIKPQFLIFVENKGKGSPANINSFQRLCVKDSAIVGGSPLTQDEIKNAWNVAFLRAYTSGKGVGDKGIQLICCPNIDGQCPENENNLDKIAGFIRFRDKKDFVRCTFKNEIKKTDDAFTSPLRIEIDYGYVQTIADTFLIQKPIKY